MSAEVFFTNTVLLRVQNCTFFPLKFLQEEAVKYNVRSRRRDCFNTKKDEKYDPKSGRNFNEAERIQKYLQLHVSKFLMLFTTTLRIVRDCVFTYIELHCYYIVKRGCFERRPPVLLRKKAQSYCDGDTQVYSVTFFCYRRLSPPVHFLGQILLYYSSTQLKIGCNKGNSKKWPPRSSRPLYIVFF